MKKETLKWIVLYVAGLFAMALASWLVSGIYSGLTIQDEASWRIGVGIGAAIAFSVVAIICHVWAKGRSFGYLISYILNAIGSGCAIGTLLADKGIIPPPELLLALLPVAGLGIMGCLLLWIPGEIWRFVVPSVFTVAALALIGFGTYIWICRDPLIGCTFVFSGLFYLPFPMGHSFAWDKPEQGSRYLSFAGFGAFILIAFVVILILSEGEIIDVFDIDLSGKKKTKSKSP